MAKPEQTEPAAAPAVPSDPVAGLAVYRSIAAITAKLGEQGIAKARQSGSEGNERSPKFAYRGIDDVYAALNPLLAQHCLCILPRVISRAATRVQFKSGGGGTVTVLEVEFDFVSSEDGSRHTIRTIGEAMDTGDKSSNKAMSVAYKYAAFMAFAIPTEAGSDDPDANSYELDQDRLEEAPARQQQRSASENRTRDKGSRSNVSSGSTNEAIQKAIDGAKQSIRIARDMDALRKVWEKSIRWDLIPKGRLPELFTARDDRIAELQDQPSREPPAQQQQPAFEPGGFDDDIPF